MSLLKKLCYYIVGHFSSTENIIYTGINFLQGQLQGFSDISASLLGTHIDGSDVFLSFVLSLSSLFVTKKKSKI